MTINDSNADILFSKDLLKHSSIFFPDFQLVNKSSFAIDKAFSIYQKYSDNSIQTDLSKNKRIPILGFNHPLELKNLYSRKNITEDALLDIRTNLSYLFNIDTKDIVFSDSSTFNETEFFELNSFGFNSDIESQFRTSSNFYTKSWLPCIFAKVENQIHIYANNEDLDFISNLIRLFTTLPFYGVNGRIYSIQKDLEKRFSSFSNFNIVGLEVYIPNTYSDLFNKYGLHFNYSENKEIILTFPTFFEESFLDKFVSFLTSHGDQ